MPRYKNVQQIDEDHDALLLQLEERQDTKGMTCEEALAELQVPIRTFIADVSEAGRDLYLDQERSAAQGLLNYWSNALTRADLEHLPSSLLAFTEESEGAPGVPDFPFDRKGECQGVKWEHYAAGRRLKGDARKVWEALHLVAVVGAAGSGRGTVTDEIIVPAVREWMREENGAEAQVVTVASGDGALESLPEAIHPGKGRARAGEPPARTLLIIHDFRALLHRLDEGEWEGLLKAMLRWVQDGHALVLVINHSHLRLLAAHPPFLHQVTAQQVSTAYDSSELREFVELPARAAQVYFEEGLVERIVRNTQGQMGVLALLNFSLVRLWETFIARGGRKLIKRADYESVGSGRSAVDRAAEAALEKLKDAGDAVRTAFLRLVTPTLEGWETHTVPLADLQRESPGRADAIVDAFKAAKILDSRRGGGGGDLVFVRHSTLAGCWSRLQSWIEGVRDEKLPDLLLPRVARRWSREKKSPDLLWRGELLRAVEPRKSEKSAVEQRFIAAGVRARWWRRSLKAFLFAAVIAAVVTYTANLQEARARLMIDQGNRLLETHDPAGALKLFKDASERSGSGDWQARRESIAARSLPELFRCAVLKDPTLDGGARGAKAADFNTDFEGAPGWMEYSPDGAHGLIGARDFGGKPGGLLLWDFKEAAPRVVAKGRSYERVKFFSPEACGEVMVVAVSAARVGDESGRLELWRWADLRDAKGPLASLDSKELRAFPLDLAVEGSGADDGRTPDGNLVAIGTGRGNEAHASRVLLFEVKKSRDQHAELVMRNDLDDAFKGKADVKIVNAVQFSRDGRWLISGAGDVNDERGEALLFARDADGGKFRGQPRRLKHDAPVANVDFCADNRRFVTATGAQQRGPGEARLWTIRPGGDPAFDEPTSISLPHRARVVEARFSPDGRRMLTASQDGAARIWDTEKGAFISVLEHDGWIFEAHWSPDGRHVLTGSRDGYARLWDATTGLLAWPKLVHTGSVGLVRFAPDGQNVFSGAGRELRVWRWHADQAQPIPTLPQGTVTDAAFSQDGRWLATGVKRTDRSEMGEVVLSDAANGRERARFPVGGPVNKVSFSADGRWLAAGCGRRGGKGGIIRIWEVAQPEKPKAPIVTELPVVWLGFAEGPAADRLAALTHHATEKWSEISILRPSDGKPHCPPFDPQSHSAQSDNGTDETINALALSPDGKFLAVGGGDLTRKKRFFRVFDLSRANEETIPTPITIIPEAHGHLEAITALAIDSTGSRLISGSVDDSARIFDFDRLRANDKGAFLGRGRHNADVISVGFSTDGKRAYSCGYDGKVLLYDAREPGAEPRQFGRSSVVRSAAFSRDGTLLATGGDDRNARLWHIGSGDLVGIFPVPWPLATVQLSQQGGSPAEKPGSPPGGGEHLLTTAFYHAQHLARFGTQRTGPPDTASFGLADRISVHADSGAPNKRRVDARRWSISAEPAKEPVSLPPVSDPRAAHAVAANLCEEQELWTVAHWHLQRASSPAEPQLLQKLRLHSGAREWAKVLVGCAGAPPELSRRPEFLGLQAEAQIAAAGPADTTALRNALETLKKWEELDPDGLTAPLKIAEALFLLGEYDGADEKLKALTGREQPHVFPTSQDARESGSLPSLWQRRAEHGLGAWQATGRQNEKWRDRYREAAYALLKNYGGTADNGGVVAWPFALVPGDWWKGDEKLPAGNRQDWQSTLEKWKAIENMADLAVKIDPANPYRLNTLGGLLVRGGDFEKAIPTLEESRRVWALRNPPASPELAGRALDWCFLALAHDGLARQVELKAASQTAESKWHRKRAGEFAALACDQERWKSPDGAPPDKLTRLKLEFLCVELEKISKE